MQRTGNPLTVRCTEHRIVELDLQRASNDVLFLLDGLLVRQGDQELARPGGNVWNLSAEDGGVVNCDGDCVVPEAVEKYDADMITVLERGSVVAVGGVLECNVDEAALLDHGCVRVTELREEL